MNIWAVVAIATGVSGVIACYVGMGLAKAAAFQEAFEECERRIALIRKEFRRQIEQMRRRQ